MKIFRERNWSEEALAAFEAFPWESERDKKIALGESELICSGGVVQLADLPLKVRRYKLQNEKQNFAASVAGKVLWKGEALDDLVETLEKNIIYQAFSANSKNISATARALKTTARIVSYKMKKYSIK